jgi:DnaJ-class molecular chaperone
MSNDDRKTEQNDAGEATAGQNMAPGDEAPAGTPGTGEDTCPACKGSGRLDQEACPNCLGRGRVIKAIGGA